MRTTLPVSQNGQIQTPKGPWQKPGEIQQPKGPWQIPKGIQAIKAQDEKCGRLLTIRADALFDFDKSTLNKEPNRRCEP